ncbi:TolC family protein [Altererythrobacter salegens]|uniref:TolC family protein n=1 Tax=Croceibacterium salegens TaxID=1737568 RepID=A0A6I4SQY4_9SPHN|nr:TolC family protein [Croceibacterium salegens]MXO58244.1 TolC family protein [Croceibacterium salegens]
MVRLPSRGTLAGALSLGLAACMSYQPSPIDLGVRSEAVAARTLDPTRIAEEVARLAPGERAAPPGTLDRLSLFAALLAYNPRIVAARGAIATAEAEAAAARHMGAPILTLTAEYARDPATTSPWLLGTQANLPPDYGVRRSARLDRAGLAVLLARYDFVETVWAERMVLNRALIDYFAAEARIPVLEEQLAVQDRGLAAFNRRVALGESAAVIVYPYRTQRLATARLLDEERAREADARVAVAVALGLPAKALAGEELHWANFASTDALPLEIDAAERARASAARADILRKLVAYDQAEADLRLEVARQYPAVSIGPGFTWERGLVKLPFSIDLALPSWDLNRAAIGAAVARRAEAGGQIEAAIAAAQGSIEVALSERAAALTTEERIRTRDLPLAEAWAEKAEAQINRGAINRTDWAAAQIQLYDARLAALDALVRLRRANAALEEALRRPLGGPEAGIMPGVLEVERGVMR